MLIHSRKSDAGEVLSFARAWQNRLPVVIVPTKYFRTPASEYRDAKISAVIWANHSMRAAVRAMRNVCSRILADESIAGIEAEVASLDTVFELMNYGELASAEGKYLPRSANANP